MQITSTLSFATLAAIASAASTFDLLSIRSGSLFHLLSVTQTDNGLFLSGGDAVTFELTDDQTLQDTKSKNYIKVDENYKFIETDDKSQASKGFGVQDGYLTYGNTGFYGCPDDSGHYQLTTSCSNPSGSPVALKVTNEKDSGSSSVISWDSSSNSATTLTTMSTSWVESTSVASTTPTASTSDDAAWGNIKFGIIAIRSGTKFQNAAIKKVDSHPHVFSVGGTEGSDLTLTLKPDGTLVDQDGRGIYLDHETGELGNVDPWGQEKPTSGFSIKNGDLVYKNKNNWKACPSGSNTFSLANNDCTGGTGIALHAVIEN